MTYRDVFTVIAEYAPVLIPAFEAHEQRFPTEPAASIIADELRDRAQYYRGDILARLNQAADEVLRQARQS